MESKVWYVTVYVRDFERAIAFYRDTLGLPLNFAEEEFGYASFNTPGAGFALARVADDDDRGLVGRHTGIGIGVPDLTASYEELKAKGVAFPMPPEKQPWGRTLAIFADPEGNELFLDQLRDER